MKKNVTIHHVINFPHIPNYFIMFFQTFFSTYFTFRPNYGLEYLVQQEATEPTNILFTKCNFGLLGKIWINFPIELSAKTKQQFKV